MHLFGCKQTPPTPPTTSDEESSGSSDDAEMKKKKGNRAMGKSKYPKAVKYYTKAIRIDPQQPTFYLNRAIANSALELWKDAENDASNAVDLGDPPSVKSYWQLARARLRRGLHSEAQETAKAGLAAYPGEKSLLQLEREIERATQKAEAKRAREAEAEAQRQSCTQGPAATKSLMEQARSAHAAGQFEKAAALLNDVRAAVAAGSAGADLRRDEINALSLLGKVNLQLRKFPEAVEAFKELVKHEEDVFSMDNPQEREALSNAYNNMGIACKNAGDMQGAVQALNSAYQRATNCDDQMATPQTAQILQNLGQCLRAQKKPQEARSMYTRALEICRRFYRDDHASHALNYLCIARCLREEAKIKEAIESYTKALEIWVSKEPEECVAEMPEVPSKDRLSQLQQQCKAELGQLIAMVEQARQGGLPSATPESDA